MKKKSKRHRTPRLTPAFIKRYLLSTLFALLLGGALWIQNNLPSQLPPPEPGEPAELYANQSQGDLTSTFCSAINKAENSVLLIIYSLTDPQIIDALKQKGEEGLPVHVVCDAKASPYVDSKLGSKVSVIRRFGPGLMHQKILVIDHKQTWIGSANMTTESLRMHGNLVAAVDSKAFADEIHKKASTLKVEGREDPFPHTGYTIGGQHVELWFLPDNPDAVSRLKNLIQSAQKTIRIAMFTWTRNDLAQNVIAAAKRGVKTEVVIDHYSGKGASAKVVALLKKNGIKVALSPGGTLLHHKFLYIDEHTLVNGSANWTKAAFTQNDDCFIVLNDLTQQQKERMNALWDVILSSSVDVVKN